MRRAVWSSNRHTLFITATKGWTDVATTQHDSLATGQLNKIWVGSVVAGLLGGVLFGLIMQFVMDAISSVGALYGIEGVTAGWVFHLFHAAVFGIAFGIIVTTPAVRARIPDPGTMLFLGAVWGLFLWLVAASIVMPIWLGGVTDLSPVVPNVDLQSGVGHLVYGLTLAGVLAVLDRERYRKIES